MRFCSLTVSQNPRRNLYAPILKLFSCRAFYFALGVFFRHCLAFIVQLFAFAKPKLHLDPFAGKIERQRDDCVALLPYQPEQAQRLLFVQEQPAVAQRVPVEYIPLFIRADMHSEHINLAVDDAAVAVLQVDGALPQRLDLGAGQLDAGLQRLWRSPVCPTSAAPPSFAQCTCGPRLFAAAPFQKSISFFTFSVSPRSGLLTRTGNW